MSEEISLESIKTTQNILGDFVKKPPLTEKLLKKPPFRFLHDIITAIIKNTGFFDGLFTEDYLISENVKEKEKKIEFLQKIIKVVNIVTVSKLTVKPSKIISGQEPEKTNELLQQIGIALKKKLTSTDAVRIVLNELSQNTNIENTKTKNIQKKDKNSMQIKHSQIKSSENLKDVKNVKDINLRKKPIDIKTKENPKMKKNINTNKDKLIKKKEVEKNTRELKVDKIGTNDEKTRENFPIKESDLLTVAENDFVSINDTLNSSVDIKNVNYESNENQTQSIDHNCSVKSTELESNNVTSDLNNKETDTIVVNSTREVYENDKINGTCADFKVTIKTNDIKNEVENNDNDENIKNKPDTVESNIINDKVIITETKSRPRSSLRPPSVRPPSSRIGAPRIKEIIDVMITPEIIIKDKVKIIIENYEKQDDDNSVTVESSILDNIINNDDYTKIKENISDHGHLVQQIIETQRELGENISTTDIEWELGAKRERETSYKEITIVKDNLQLLSRVTNPLGKLIEFIQEDVEIMRQELIHWKEMKNEAANILHQQEILTEKSILPLEGKLKQLEENISDQIEIINTAKSNINRNNEKIKRLIGGDTQYI